MKVFLDESVFAIWMNVYLTGCRGDGCIGKRGVEGQWQSKSSQEQRVEEL